MFREGGESPPVSMRRVLAFIFALSSVALGVLSLVKGVDWKAAIVASGLPIVACLFLLFFTTWADVAEIATALKKG